MDYYHIPATELGRGSRLPLKVLGSSGEVFYEMALDMVREIERNNAEGRRTTLICPVGPVGQYPIFVRLVNERRLSLRDCWFFNMDEYLTSDGAWISADDALSFRGFMDRNVYGRIEPDLLMPPEQRVFPDPKDPGHIDRLIDELGGIDLCLGGIGITGHLAFNEPEAGMSAERFGELPSRVVEIRPETRSTNCAADLGGALEDMPTRAITIGMRQILGARKIRLGVFRGWHRGVCRRAAYGEVTSEFPATLAQGHPDALVYVNDVAAGTAYEGKP